MHKNLKIITRPNFLSRLEYISLIHSGPFNDSWLCYDKNLEKVVFVKHSLCNTNNLKNEAGILQRLEFSNYFPKYYDYLHSDDTNSDIVIMEYFEGENLRKLRGTFDVRFTTKEILKGIKDLHSIGFVHNDIKPANLFLTKSKQLKILDLEMSRRVGTPCPATTYEFQKKDITNSEFEHDFYSLMKTVEWLNSGV